MLDLFTIFSKGGIVLWYFQGTCQAFESPVNALIKSIILQERGGSSSFNHGSLTLKYKLDNEFELIFVVAYQKILSLSYVDKFIDDVHLEFRDKYKEDLKIGSLFGKFDFTGEFERLLQLAEKESREKAKIGKQMRTFEESQKSKKTVASMKIEPKKEEKNKTNKAKKSAVKPEPTPAQIITNSNKDDQQEQRLDEETIRKNRERLFNRAKPKKVDKSLKVSAKDDKKKKGKEARQWSNGGTVKDMPSLDYSAKNDTDGSGEGVNGNKQLPLDEQMAMVGSMAGDLQNIDESSGDEVEEEEEEVEEPQKAKVTNEKPSKSSGFGVFNMFRGLVGSKSLTKEDMAPAMNKMQDHLTAKNVARDIAEKLCDSVSTKLEGKVMGTLSRVTSVIREGIEESLVQILSPRRRIDILRDAMEARSRGKPYSMVFCGVNGVGKSTNLAKICFWLVENGFAVLIAACDTFRAGAVEQLRTHTRHLNALHPAEKHGGRSPVQLYEKGYGKDAAGIAMEAIKYARDCHFDIVLIDTAGRMQDNEPLMRALSKLIKINQPDLVLFVGEALVGNEAVDQLTKFNRALADHSDMDQPRLIDGIVLTKFDTIDDKVGAAISMTYTTGQPIVFVGTGQTYRDLRKLNVKAVVKALLKN
ncbi:signal recognition particle receptor subunit alpha-like [Acanthaster planci]|uniref:Signal recognition particle receptor subunit alpha-like n=1 Tax=Acanthaster planci TaxID=133434 RepID=A0A8B8A0K2_ACAPL|nr:signal recognition particle receptor subunit alpha-like [Acanthaster planci]